MKLISLNTWCGVKYDQLMEFIKQQSSDTDIFCFQEIRNGEYANQLKVVGEKVNQFQELGEILSDHIGHFTKMVTGIGIATFVRKNIEIENLESTVILNAKDIKHLAMPNGSKYYPRVMQSIRLKNDNLIIHNFHGIPGNFKKDTPERNLQTDHLLQIISSSDSPQILVGDFNLDMNTEAVLRLSVSMSNLVKENGIKTTRNENYSKFETLPYADYAFVSKNIVVNRFEVLPDEVSDHLALSLVIER